MARPKTYHIMLSDNEVDALCKVIKDKKIIIKYNISPNSSAALRKADGRVEAHLIQIACGPAPEGHSRWTIRLLEEKNRIELETPVSRETIRRVFKNDLRPHRSGYWCIPPKEDAEFIACMEDVLDTYELPYNSMRPVVCMDESCYKSKRI